MNPNYSMKMFKFYKWSLFFVSIIIIESATLSSNKQGIPCNELCTIISDPIPKYSGNFNYFEDAIFEYNTNESKKNCYSACNEAYKQNELKECIFVEYDGRSYVMVKNWHDDNWLFFTIHLQYHDKQIEEENNMNQDQSFPEWQNTAGEMINIIIIFYVMMIFAMRRTVREILEKLINLKT